ncbi:MAG: 1-acyl-sn-glycerol-3-phosphate acyltransferase [Bacteroidales bacterium]|jgi:1-acyl-sn-glycerol-3-phosphate acyltransferase|nr:1-acyl-sn-glycerol-3-phosphate acyltransferase [Bacteroidales bacterium]
MKKTLTEKLSKNSWGYALCRFLWTKPNHTRYYRHIRIIGKENIPPKGPLIYAANHQNALMDALAILCTQKHQAVFVARADIFKKPQVAKILNFLRILPIYRKRDGGNSVDNNQETFEIVDQVLRSGMVHGILPEGIFNPRKRLSTLQKGVFRTALKAQEFYGEKGGVQIVPVGLNWQNPRGFFKDITVVYGKPIAVSEFFPLYQENPAKAYLQMQDKLTDEMRRLMIDIQNETHYDTIENCRATFGYEYAEATNRDSNNPKQRLEAEQDLVKKLDEIAEQNEPKIEALGQTLEQYQRGLHQLGIRSWLLRFSKISSYELVEDFGVLGLGAPFACIGFLLGLLPLGLSKKFEKLIKDQQFLSSTRFVVSLVVRGIQNVVLIVVLLLTFNNIIQFVFMLALILYGERLMLFYVQHYKRTMGKYRYYGLLKTNDTQLNTLKEQRAQMLSTINQ